MRLRTFVVFPDSRFLLGTSCGLAHQRDALRLDLRVRIDQECDVQFAFYDPNALRLLASAANTLLANYRRCEFVLPAAGGLRSQPPPQPPTDPSPLQIWDRLP